jgi:5-methylcytosine-specific restriction endonuclease McrA
MAQVKEAKRRQSPLTLRSLVLNADYLPLTTWPLSLIPARDAVAAVYQDKVDVVENWPDQFFHSPSVTIPVPKVVALREYAPIHADPKFCRRSIFLRDHYKCQYCGGQFASQDLTFDHVLPRSRGGKTEWRNITTACIPCNADRRNNVAIQPKRRPHKPTTAELLRAGLEFLPSSLREDFGSWLYWDAELEE